MTDFGIAYALTFLGAFTVTSLALGGVLLWIIRRTR